MSDVYAAAGTFGDKHPLAQDLAKAVMRWEEVPEISLFKNNTAAFVHDLPAVAISNAAGETNYLRVQVLTPATVLDRDKQIAHLSSGDSSVRTRAEQREDRAESMKGKLGPVLVQVRAL
jgi:hypothetical protein